MNSYNRSIAFQNCFSPIRYRVRKGSIPDLARQYPLRLLRLTRRVQRYGLLLRQIRRFLRGILHLLCPTLQRLLEIFSQTRSSAKSFFKLKGDTPECEKVSQYMQYFSSVANYLPDGRNPFERAMDSYTVLYGETYGPEHS